MVRWRLMHMGVLEHSQAPLTFQLYNVVDLRAAQRAWVFTCYQYTSAEGANDDVPTSVKSTVPGAAATDNTHLATVGCTWPVSFLLSGSVRLFFLIHTTPFRRLNRIGYAKCQQGFCSSKPDFY
mmetsp:Transcript_9818/g.35987  ORF Transcript_9818/g.35987 Transcript_9818/m.35987 type:complete len:124 (-) Transcript_9818:1564-1935(-)